MTTQANTGNQASQWQRIRAALVRHREVWSSWDFLAAAITGTLIAVSWLIGLADLSLPWLAPAVGLAAVAVGGATIALGALRGLMQRRFNVDELVTIAIVAAVIAGEYLSAGLVAFMMLFGKALEDLTAQRAEHALTGLGRLLPATAHRKTPTGDEEAVPLAHIRPDDLIIVRPGERVPVDGVVAGGQAAVDQAAVTGESVPLAKGGGDEVLAGSIALGGSLEVRTSRVGDATAVGRIGQLVATAEDERAPVVRQADRYATYFTPAVLVLAGAVFAITQQWLPAVTVLVVACPCALVMATPTAVLAGIANGARRGLLIKGGARLEAAGRVTTVAFDKTGTLTRGRPRVVRTLAFDGATEGEVLALAAAVEQRSEHPLATAVLTAATAADVAGMYQADPASFRAIPGRGAAAVVAERLVLVGSPAWLDEQGIQPSPAAAAPWDALLSRGETALGIGVDGQLRGALTVADVPRPEAAATVAELRTAGIGQILLLTGDSPAAARTVAQHVGIPAEHVHAGLLPEAKVQAIKAQQAAGEVVAMIGDGVNDAPALAAADVAIAVGVGGTDVALEVSDIALLTDDLHQAAAAILLSRRTLRTIRQNLVLALVWNVAALVAAAAGALGPVAGALVHNIGSVAVVINAARLAGAPRPSGPSPSVKGSEGASAPTLPHAP